MRRRLAVHRTPLPWLLGAADEGDLSAVVADARGPRGHWRRFATVGALVFVLVGVSLATVLRTFELRRYVPAIDDAAALLHTEPPPSIVFLGTSVTARAVIPEVVDGALAAAGCEGRSANFAMGGATPEEYAWLVDVVAQQLPDDTLVVLEPLGVHNLRTDRWSTARRQRSMRLAASPIVLADLRARDASVVDYGRFFAAAVRTELGFAQLHDALFFSRPPAEGEPARAARLRGRGWTDKLRDEPPSPGRLRFEQRVRRHGVGQIWPEKKRKLDQWRPAEAQVTLELLAYVEARGLRPILLLPPTGVALHTAAGRTAARLKPSATVLDFSVDTGALRFPDAELYYDGVHLTTVGARKFSRLLGTALCERLQARR